MRRVAAGLAAPRAARLPTPRSAARRRARRAPRRSTRCVRGVATSCSASRRTTRSCSPRRSTTRSVLSCLVCSATTKDKPLSKFCDQVWWKGQLHRVRNKGADGASHRSKPLVAVPTNAQSTERNTHAHPFHPLDHRCASGSRSMARSTRGSARRARTSTTTSRARTTRRAARACCRARPRSALCASTARAPRGCSTKPRCETDTTRFVFSWCCAARFREPKPRRRSRADERGAAHGETRVNLVRARWYPARVAPRLTTHPGTCHAAAVARVAAAATTARMLRYPGRRHTSLYVQSLRGDPHHESRFSVLVNYRDAAYVERLIFHARSVCNDGDGDHTGRRRRPRASR